MPNPAASNIKVANTRARFNKTAGNRNAFGVGVELLVSRLNLNISKYVLKYSFVKLKIVYYI